MKHGVEDRNISTRHTHQDLLLGPPWLTFFQPLQYNYTMQAAFFGILCDLNQRVAIADTEFCFQATWFHPKPLVLSVLAGFSNLPSFLYAFKLSNWVFQTQVL